MRRVFTAGKQSLRRPKTRFLVVGVLLVALCARPVLEERLICCATQNNGSAVRCLLALGVDANTRASDPYTAITVASGSGYTEVVRQLLASGGDPNAEVNFGETALAYAALNGHRDIVELLLAHGANPNWGCREMDPLSMARLAKRQDIVRLLKAAAHHLPDGGKLEASRFIGKPLRGRGLSARPNMNNDQTLPTYDVIISGAGPVGLFLACELALARCSVLILEKAKNPHSLLKRLPFGIRGLSAPTIEALDRRGLLDELEVHKRLKNPHQNAKQGPQRQGGHFAGIPFQDGNVDTAQWPYRLPSSTPTSLISEMEELESMLSRRAETLGVKIKRGLAITDFHQTDDGVTVRTGDHSFQSKWLVGCDGARSVVRKAGGFDFAGTEPEFTGTSAQVDIADPEKLCPGRTLTTTGMYFQSQPGYLVMLEFDGGAAHHPEKPVTREHVQEALRRVSNTDVTLRALHSATTWTDRARQTTAYRSGRILLAGDAAHIHSPLGGQGLNLGLGDAMNLGWKLAATIHEKAAEGLLDSYTAERHPIGAQVLDWSRAQVAIMGPSPQSRALNAIVRDLINTRDGATYFAGRVWGVFTQYDLGDGHPLVGHSVPNFELEDGTTVGERMRDGHGILLDFDSNASLQTLASTYGDSVKYVAGRAKEHFGVRAALIRPDGFIAWASDSAPDEPSLRQVAALWFACSS